MASKSKMPPSRDASTSSTKSAKTRNRDVEVVDFATYAKLTGKPSLDLGHIVDVPQDMDVDLEMEMQSAPSTRRKERLFTIEPCGNLIGSMHEMISQIVEHLEISQTGARLILVHKRWNLDDALAFFYDLDERYGGSRVATKIAELLHIPLAVLKPKGDPFKVGNGQSEEMCPICIEDVFTDQIGFMSCLHKYCLNCWANHLQARITGDIDDRVIVKCMEPDCKMILDDTSIASILCACDDPDSHRAAAHYEKLIESKFINSQPRLQICRGTDCKNAIRVFSVDAIPLKCDCGHVQCSACTAEGHEGLPCPLVEKWIKKIMADTDQANIQWLMANTKECPKCKFNIEKNGGCNHMTCRRCLHEFCWLCGEEWRGHGNNGCAQYCGDKNDNFTALAWEEVERLIFYASRYTNQLDSIKKEKPLKDLPAQLVAYLEENPRSAHYEDFLAPAVATLEECRRSVWQCYGFSYFVKKCVDREIFDYNLNLLEEAVEQLSGFLEKDLCTNIGCPDHRTKTIDLANNCASRRKILVSHLEHGFKKRLWTFPEKK